MNEDVLRDHLETPFHDGLPSNATVVKSKRNPTCGDEVTLSLIIESDHIVAAWQQVRGCMLCKASASILCERLQDVSLSEAQAISEQDALNWIEIPVTPGRRGCCTLPVLTLKELLQAAMPSAKE